MKEICIVLTKSNTFLSHLINFLDPSEYTHSSIAFDKSLDEMYSVGRKYAFFWLMGNLKKEYLDKGFYHYFDNTKIGVYSLNVSDESYKAMKEYVDELNKENTKLQYSFLGIIFCRFDKSYIRKNKMFCSQFVTTVLNKANENLIDIAPELCKPKDLLKVKGLNCLYVGKVADLVKIRNNSQLDNIFNS